VSYIQELRKYVGNQPLIMVGAAVLVLDHERRLLLMRRTDNGFWGVPGGSMEPGESLEETAIRETKEETGLVVEQLDLFGVFSGPGLYYKYPNGAEVYNVTVVYRSRLVNGTIDLDPHEHSDFQYFDISHLPEDVSPPIKLILAELVRRYHP
jgi:8-oxo-dGTP pyrophosphatase MutT (NUDIX family)